MAPPSDAKAALKDTFHHYIPRFTLREFIIGQTEKKTQKQTKQERRERKTKDETPQSLIYVYDIEKGTLEKHPPGKVYGVENLYADYENTEDVQYVEKMFSSLEGTAGVTLKKIHESVKLKTGKVELRRKELESLRKYIFLMYFRAQQHSGSYFNEELMPMAKKRITQLKTLMGTTSSRDLWLKVLQFYLEHPHSYFRKKAGEGIDPGEIVQRLIQDFYDLLTDSAHIDDHDKLLSCHYLQNTDFFFLQICEAADGHEFVLSNNSYGLWEGTCFGGPGIHRLYIMSPTIAFILRHNMFSDNSNSFLINSDFVDIVFTPPLCEHHSLKLRETDSQTIRMQKLNEYRLTSVAEKDRFSFTINKLTPQQTLNVNKVILLNLTKSLTFRSERCMHDTLQTYLASTDPFEQRNKHLYERLLLALGGNSSSTPGTGTSHSESQTQPNLHMSVFAAVALSHLMAMPRYERAWATFPKVMTTEEGGLNFLPFRNKLDSLVSRSASVLNREIPKGYYPRRLFRLITAGLSVDKATVVFLKSRRFISKILAFQIEDETDELYCDVLVIGWIRWLANNRDDHLTEIFTGSNTPQERRVQLLDFIL